MTVRRQDSLTLLWVVSAYNLHMRNHHARDLTWRDLFE